ncbi:insulin-induced gene 2 protein isoform X2 [Microtus pennsylvanicus]|uniref:insulin-induced gene 2 protein isoform X2 n=1 Tax=Microtus pennsylvanicus TaxID=10058 RepID=UPI003F6B7DB6
MLLFKGKKERHLMGSDKLPQILSLSEQLSTMHTRRIWFFIGKSQAVIGLLYPCIDRHLGEPHKFKREWSSVMRCVAVFVGINHASAKVDFDNNFQFSLTLAALSVGLWWTFDRSRSGFGLGVGIAFLATVVTQLLVYNGVYQYTSPDFLYVRSWLPCIFFAGGITMGNIGRQLAMYECKVIPEKSHQE